MQSYPARIVHNGRGCPVCATTTPTLVVQAGPLPPPYKNPMYKGAPKGNAKSNGGQHGHDWYHGTAFNPRNDEEEHDPYVQESGGRLRTPQSTEDQHGMPKHWNTTLGVHFSSLHEVANKFAFRSPGASRIAHAHLHMRNPAHYKDEREMAQHAIEHAHSQGIHFIPNHPEAQHEWSRNTPDYGKIAEHDRHGVDYEDLGDILLHSQRQRIGRIDQEGPQGHRLEDLELHLAHHPHREQVVDSFREHLKSKGHDGIVYGNDHEGPAGHPSAIAFPSTPVNIHHWEHLGGYDAIYPSSSSQAYDRRLEPKRRPPEEQMRLFGSRRIAGPVQPLHEEDSPFGYHVKHYDIGERNHRVFVTDPGGKPDAHRIDYKITPEDRIKFYSYHGPEENGMAHQTAKDYVRAVWHPDLEEHGPQHDPHAGPPKAEQRFYHGTVVPNVKKVLPANVHKGQVVFPHDTSYEHAYATTSHDDAWDYAEKAWNSDDQERRPRVYEVKPIGGLKHVEEDPRFDQHGRPRSNNANDYRSKKGWQVVREVPMPEHMGDPEDWDR